MSSVLALFYSARGRTYGGRGQRSGLETRSFKCVLDPCPETALDYQGVARLGLIEAVVNRLQSSQGGDGIEIECVVS